MESVALGARKERLREEWILEPPKPLEGFRFSVTETGATRQKSPGSRLY
jgi:hypothetical protein